ncbi:hypothetical protein [Parvularcula lutaonensis]|uniref:Gylcosyl hydrolase 115 C-terminal domain-containing protein n=1 Tax=Parvularcula lutaonensis TaxID=491923 RepID=A0ABV7MEV9_9PROT|nr:hypothetical protein [Parvularcula lutaonensis]GGY51966.1 hypothetical protein GCM10007148_21170 [Parvularcula lutaonensis]
MNALSLTSPLSQAFLRAASVQAISKSDIAERVRQQKTEAATRTFSVRNRSFVLLEGRVDTEIQFAERLLKAFEANARKVTSSSIPAVQQNASVADELAALEAFAADVARIAKEGTVDLEGLAPPSSVAKGLSGLSPLTETVTRPAEVILIEAEKFSRNTAGSRGYNWETKVDGTGVLASEVKGNFRFEHTEVTKTHAGRLDYTVDFEAAGTYKVGVLGRSQIVGDTDSNSVHVGLNGEVYSGRGGIAVSTTAEAWGSTDTHSGQEVAINIDVPGRHTFNMWVREDGTSVDAIRLTPAQDTQIVEEKPLGFDLSDVEAVIAAARNRLTAKAEAGTTVENRGTVTGMNSEAMEVLIEAQRRGLDRLRQTEEARHTEFVTNFVGNRVDEVMAGTSPVLAPGYGVTLGIASLFTTVAFEQTL